MKIKHHIKILGTSVIQLVVAIIGLFVVPIAYIFKSESNLPNWAWPWGNDKDGLYTDNPSYRPSWIKPQSFLDAYYWLAIRNPARNFSEYLGYKTDDIKTINILQPGYIDKSSIKILVTTKDGKEYPFIYYYKRIYKDYVLLFKYGWKNWSVVEYDKVKDLEKLKNKKIQFVLYPQIRKK